VDPDSPMLMILCEEEIVKSLTVWFREHSIEAQASPRRNLDGAVLPWLVVAALAIKAAPDTLRALGDFLTRTRVKSIEYRGIVISNPRPEDVDHLIMETFHPNDLDPS
jgi:hypothetical protein